MAFLSCTVTTQWLHDHLSDPDLVILDASLKKKITGPESVFKDNQIPGARHFDFKNVFHAKDTELPNMLPSPEEFEKECQKLGISTSSNIIVYDNAGIYSSPRVWWMFNTMGHDNIAVLDGGLPEWVAHGFEVEPIQTHSVKEGNFKSKFHPERVKNLTQIKTNIPIQDSLVIDARSEGRFHGVVPEPRAGLRGGNIPGSLNIPFEEVLKEGKFKSKEELREIFAAKKLADKPLVFTCGSGITACIVMMAKEMVLENPASIYDGSWTEWAQKV